MNTSLSLNRLLAEQPDITPEMIALMADVYLSTVYKCIGSKRIKPESERRITEAIHAYHNHHSDPHLRP
jgi:predicted transcriptional regulator